VKLDLAPSQREEVLQLLEQALGPEVEVFAFGSRVQGNARPFSDLDLLLKSVNPISYAQLAEAEELLLHIPAHRDRPFRLNVTACSGRS
jgi:predicted nucleotidyltransferase